jgi:excinuclease UvrABC ATPase subunit
LPELSARLFSFNSPYGACPDCKGLGVKWEIDPESLIDEDKPVEEAINAWAGGGWSMRAMLPCHLHYPNRHYNKGYSTGELFSQIL